MLFLFLFKSDNDGYTFQQRYVFWNGRFNIPKAISSIGMFTGKIFQSRRFSDECILFSLQSYCRKIKWFIKMFVTISLNLLKKNSYCINAANKSRSRQTYVEMYFPNWTVWAWQIKLIIDRLNCKKYRNQNRINTYAS